MIVCFLNSVKVEIWFPQKAGAILTSLSPLKIASLVPLK